MPKFEALYYPDYEPPEKWLRKYLLVFDTIRSIIPITANVKLQDYILEMQDKIPNSFVPESPMKSDLEYIDFNINRLDKSFKLIKEKERTERVKRTGPKIAKVCFNRKHKLFEFEPSAGEFFIHADKLTQFIYSSLDKHKLIYPANRNYTKAFTRKDYYVVNEEAGNLIISSIADSIATRKGIDTVTKHRMDFTVNSLNSMKLSSVGGDRRSLLVNAIVKFEVPAEVATIPLSKYLQIREAYEDIREPFHKLVSDLTTLHRLEDIEDIQILGDRIKELSVDFHKELIKFRKSKLARNVKQWLPLGLGSLLTILGAVAEQRGFAIGTATLSVMLQFVQKITRDKETDSEVLRLFSGMQRDIRTSEIRKLI